MAEAVSNLDVAVAKTVSAAESSGGKAASAGAAGLRNGRTAKVVPGAVLGVAGRANSLGLVVDADAGGLELLHVQDNVGAKGVDVDGFELSVHDLDGPVLNGSTGDQEREQGREDKCKLHGDCDNGLRVVNV